MVRHRGRPWRRTAAATPRFPAFLPGNAPACCAMARQAESQEGRARLAPLLTEQHGAMAISGRDVELEVGMEEYRMTRATLGFLELLS